MTTNHQNGRRGALAKARLDLANEQSRIEKFKRENARLVRAIVAHRDAFKTDAADGADERLWAAVDPARTPKVGA